MKCSFIKLVPALAVLASCSGAKVYQSNDTESLIANQKTLAIACRFFNTEETCNRERYPC